MAFAEYSVLIRKPVHDVYEFILNGENNKLWRPSVTAVSKVTAGEIRIGTQFSQMMKGPFGKSISGDYEIISSDLDKAIVFKVISGPARPTGNYVLEENGEETKVTFTLSYTPTGFAKLMDPMINKQMQQETAMLINIKNYFEN